MSREFKLMVLANVLFVFLYVYLNWSEYSMLNRFTGPVSLSAHFPWYIQIYGQTGLHDILMFDNNVFLWLFLLAVFVNLYFIIRLQRSKETKLKI
jgi:hypothetical protein